MKRFLLFFILFLFCNNSFSQDNDSPIVENLKFEFRGDFDARSYDDSTSSGFGGKYINFIINGHISNKFSYLYRHRLSKTFFGDKAENYQTFLNGVDLLYLKYDINDNFSLTTGKLCVAIGGWEYDLPPIDVYYASYFWDNINCYELGASAAFTSNSKNHTLMFQFANSPFSSQNMSGIYGYSLIWYGAMNFFKTSYSANVFEYEKGKYISYIALGNKLEFNKFHAYLDIMNRGGMEHDFALSDDVTAILEAKYFLCENFALHVKGLYDRNKSGEDYDVVVPDGVECVSCGIGAEFFPLKGRNDIRCHAFFAAGNDIANDILEYQANVGVTWRINVIKK